MPAAEQAEHVEADAGDMLWWPPAWQSGLNESAAADVRRLVGENSELSRDVRLSSNSAGASV